jgi:hypothetical protein
MGHSRHPRGEDHLPTGNALDPWSDDVHPNGSGRDSGTTRNATSDRAPPGSERVVGRS